MMTHKNGWISIFAAAGLLLVAVTADAGVVGSKHDFTAPAGTAPGGGASQGGGTTVTDEVCVFCHTPHGSATGAPVPLWNKVLSTGSYTRYSSLNLPSFTSTEAAVGSVSLACLSCHDGTQAMDVVLNRPGSSGYEPGGSEIDAGAIGQMVGVPAGAPVPNLGTDLSNDHPISMQYGGGGATVGDTDGTFSGTLGDPDFILPEKATINGRPIWWVDSPVGTAGTREKTDMLLYARDDLTTVQPFVECGSCHDPHNDSTGGPSSVQFLRIDNTASQICTACHIK
jgi:hypothetical protein